MLDETADHVGREIEDRLSSFLSRFVRSSIKLIYSEQEAAQFLCVSKATLEAWRKRGLIPFTRYPMGRTDGNADRLGGICTYHLNDLIDFHKNYKQNARESGAVIPMHLAVTGKGD